VTAGTGAGSGPVSAAGALTATGYTLRSGSGPTSAVGELTADGIGAEPPAGAGTITVAGSLTSTGYRMHLGAGDVTATGTLVGIGDGVRTGSGPIAATGALAGGGRRQPKGSGPTTAASAMVGAGGGGVRQGSGPVSAVAALTGHGVMPVTLPSTTKRIVFHIPESFTTTGPAPASQFVIANRLSLYVHDCNTVLAKSTDLQYSYDPNTDCIFYSGAYSPPFYGSFPYPDDYILGVWPYHKLSGVSAGATAWRTAANEFSSVHNGWIAVWGESQIDGGDLVPNESRTISNDYGIQVSGIVHEHGHMYGLGYAEYYFLSAMFDETGESPDLSCSSAIGPYWTDRSLLLFDPMRLNANSRSQFRNDFEFGPLSSAMINGSLAGNTDTAGQSIKHVNYVSPPNTFEITVEVRRAATSGVISGATVNMYAPVDNDYGPPTFRADTLLNTGTTDVSGRVTFEWGRPGDNTMFVADNHARLFKASAGGFNNGGDILGCFDMQAGITMPGGGTAGDFRYPGVLVIELTE
jgi:hypothetical protein